MSKKIFLLTTVCLVTIFSLQAQIHDYGVAETPWNEDFGNHRAIIQVNENTTAAYVKIHWRRRDAKPQDKRIIVTDERGKQVANIYRININRDFGEFVFEPGGAGKFYVYYMPYTGKKNVGWWDGKYLGPEERPNAGWLERNKLSENSFNEKSIHHAAILKIESRTAFDSFYPMEVGATQPELTTLVNREKENFLLFPEDREHPIKMKDNLPYRWLQQMPSGFFKGKALKNEYYAFQVGVYAAKTDLKNIRVSFSGTNKVTCFNTGGIDAEGKAFVKSVNVTKGNVQPLWFGVDIPETQKPGKYTFTITITPQNEMPQTILVALDIVNKVLADRGDSEPWRHSRLRWLNSKLGIDDNPVAPYTAMHVSGKNIQYLMGQVTLTDMGLPGAIIANKQTLVKTPVAFLIETEQGIEKIKPSGFRFTKTTSGVISWEAVGQGQSVTLTGVGRMEFDGTIHYALKVKAIKNIKVKDIRLEIPVEKENATYFMGMGLPGTNCPETYNWKWKGPQDSYWIGSVNAGLHCELQGADYSGPLLNLYHPAPPAAWYNNDKGGFSITTTSSQKITTTYSGERNLNAGEDISFSFRLLVTPVKKQNTYDQFVNRYYHNGNKPAPSLSDLSAGIKITNVHHANPINPYINYPFIAVDSMRNFVNYWKGKGLKVKIYYTIRELTNQVPEIWALRSLGDEILAGGKGGGFPWLQEHFIDNYDVQWFNKINGYEECDAAVRTSGKSRWYNYYINGLQWLVKNVGIDGLYLDDVSFDRNMLKRMRKVMDGVKPGCLLDLHSNTGFSKGPANQYTEYFPFINKLWFGESFMYDKMPPENWMVEVSGIPFGLMGDMLHGGGNPWRGMLYGMTVRYPWGTEGVTCDPRDIWKVWDDFGIARSKMMGYWEKECPVATDNKQVLATAYVNKGKTLISVASWAKDTVSVKLNIDWKVLGLDPSKAKLVAPGIPNFQPAKNFDIRDDIIVAPTKGWLLILE